MGLRMGLLEWMRVRLALRKVRKADDELKLPRIRSNRLSHTVSLSTNTSSPLPTFSPSTASSSPVLVSPTSTRTSSAWPAGLSVDGSMVGPRVRMSSTERLGLEVAAVGRWNFLM